MGGERDEQQRIKRLVHALGGSVWDTSQGFRGGSRSNRTTRIDKGLPDLLIFVPAKSVFFFWEVKAPGGRVGDDQLKFKDFCDRCNVDAGIGTFDDFKQFLTRYGYGFL